MRKLVFTLCTYCFLGLSLLSAQAGNPARASDSTTLKAQFDDMVRVSNRYQQFKVVRQDFLNAFMANVSDSIRIYTNEIGSLKGTIAAQAEKIDKLTQDVKDRDGNVASLTEEKDSMSLLGMPLGKGMYATIMWGTIFGLLALLAFAFLRMRVAIASATDARDTSSKLSEDLDKAKKRRLEIEQTLRRQLQDEINKRNK
ncbi:MAG: hypothetical protein AAF597_01800 [Bacteroidota bacterium]